MSQILKFDPFGNEKANFQKIPMPIVHESNNEITRITFIWGKTGKFIRGRKEKLLYSEDR